MGQAGFPEAIELLSRKLLELCGVGKGAQTLELASKTSGLAQLAASLGATARFETMEARALPFPNRTFDAVFCQLGLPEASTPLETLNEVSRVLKDEGSFGVIMLGPPRSNRPFTAAAEALRRAGQPVDDAALFAFSSSERLENLLSFAGLGAVSVTPMTGVAHLHAAEDYWKLISSATGWHLPSSGPPNVPDELTVPGGSGLIFPFELLLAHGQRSPSEAAKPETWDRLVARTIQEIEELSPEEVQDRSGKGALTIVDIREPSEAGEIVKGALLIPRGLLEDEIVRRFPDVVHPIVLYSRKGERSALSARALERAGYRNVFSMEGGFQRWKELGLPTARSK
jgi:rhodanese-related sulfurtransferase/ubiquinone/menaquinone biosynthesis C-methylase UbiE